MKTAHVDSLNTFSREHDMKQVFVVLLSGFVIVCGASAHFHDAKEGEVVRVIGAHELREKLEGQEAAVTVAEVTIEAGQAGHAHRHPGPVLVYVLEGTYELGLDEQPTKIFKAGETFYEPSGSLHRVSRNPAETGRTRLIAFVLHPRDSKEIAVPEAAVHKPQ
ncbi:cupin domain-containing protein [Planctomicrobium sp. SH664]|uniref:cupin domain-containing protein n=1 Tax=Planctomicrobium sp. SH664 TaxID=3448125 RepID=UPI003F5B8AC5